MCDQFLGIGVPAPLYVDKYDEMGLGRNMLSRTLEDCGTLWAVMFPWTGCGAYQMGVLGVHPFLYFPYAFVNLLNPILAALLAFLGRNIFWLMVPIRIFWAKQKCVNRLQLLRINMSWQ